MTDTVDLDPIALAAVERCDRLVLAFKALHGPHPSSNDDPLVQDLSDELFTTVGYLLGVARVPIGVWQQPSHPRDRSTAVAERRP